jgi:hypothetical protein
VGGRFFCPLLSLFGAAPLLSLGTARLALIHAQTFLPS